MPSGIYAVGRGVARPAPTGVGIFVPTAGGQMFTQRSLRQIVLRPVKQLRERRSSLLRGKGTPAAFALRKVVIFRASRIDNASPAGYVIFLGELFPRRPRAACAFIVLRQHDVIVIHPRSIVIMRYFHGQGRDDGD